MEYRLNTSTLSNLNSLYIFLIFPSVSNSFLEFLVLVDSGSTYCFINNQFAYKHSLLIFPIYLIKLKLFDGLSNFYISEVISITICFPTSECTLIDFYVTLLNFSVFMVFEYN